MLVVGVDGPRDDGGTRERADTIMVVRVVPAERRVQVVSLPRDLWVPIPRHGRAASTGARRGRARPLLVGTVESALGIPIDRYLQVDFDGFRALADRAEWRPARRTSVRSASTGLERPAPGCVTTFDGTGGTRPGARPART